MADEEHSEKQPDSASPPGEAESHKLDNPPESRGTVAGDEPTNEAVTSDDRPPVEEVGVNPESIADLPAVDETGVHGDASTFIDDQATQRHRDDNKQTSKGSQRPEQENWLSPLAVSHHQIALRERWEDRTGRRYRSPAKGIRRTVNLNALAFLVALLVVVGGGIHVYHAYQVKRTSSLLRVQANRARSEGNVSLAIKCLTRYVDYSPQDVDAIADLALLMKDSAKSNDDYIRAYFQMARAVRKAPARHDLLRELVFLARRLGRYKDALEHLAPLIRTNPDDGLLRFYAGESYESLARYTEACDAYRESIARKPNLLEAYQRLAGLLRDKLNRPDEAIQLIDRMVDTNRELAQAYVIRAIRRRSSRDIAGAAADISIAQQKAPNDVDVLLTAADLLIAQTDASTIDARETVGRLELLSRQHPQDARPYLALSRIAIHQGQFDKAAEWLSSGLKAVPGNIPLAVTLAASWIDAGQLEKSRPQIDALKSANIAPEIIEYLEAAQRLSEKRFHEAREQFDSLRKHLSANSPLQIPIELSLGECCRQLRDYRAAITAYRRILQEYPEQEEARVRLADSLVAAGHIDDAISEYRLVAADPAVAMALTRLLIRRNLARPTNERNWLEAETLLEQKSKAQPDKVEWTVLTAMMFIERNMIDRASAVLNEARTRYPDSVSVRIGLAELYRRTGRLGEALSLLAESAGNPKDREALWIARVNYWIGLGGQDACSAISRLESDLSEFPNQDLVPLLRRLAEAYDILGKWDEAQRIWIRLAEIQPNDLATQLHLFETAVKRNDDHTVKRALDEIARVEGEDGPYRTTCEATVLIKNAETGDDHQLDRARTLLDKVARQCPEWPQIWLNHARINELEGDDNAAITNYTRAIDLGCVEPGVVYRLLRILRANGRAADADAVLRKSRFGIAVPRSAELGRLATELAAESGDLKRALSLARSNVAAQPTDYRNRLVLARCLSAAGNKNEAERVLREALRLDNSKGPIWVMLVEQLAETGRLKEATELIEDASRNVVPEQLPLTLGQCYAAVGKPREAETHFRAALASAPNAGRVLQAAADFYLKANRLDGAETILRRLIESANQVDKLQVLTARRQLASILSHSNYAKFQEGVSLIDENLADGNSLPVDLRLKARLLRQRPRLQNVLEAIRTLKRLEQREPLNADDVLLLAGLYDFAREYSEAERRWMQLLNSWGDNPEYVARYADRLLKAKRIQDAAPWIRRLQQISPDSFASFEFTTRLDIATGRTRAALGQINSYWKAATGEAEQTSRLGKTARMVAGIAKELGDQAGSVEIREELEQEAERLYRLYVARNPNDPLGYAVFLAQLNRLDDAINLCEGAASKSLNAAVLVTAVNLLRQGQPNATHFQRIDNLVQNAGKKFPDSTWWLLQLAALRDIEGRYDEAIAAYRHVLDQNSGDIVSLNNLAWFLAAWKGNVAEARQLIDRAIDTAGPVPALLDTKGFILLQSGDTVEAVDLFERVIAEHDTPVDCYHLAVAHWKANDRPAAEFNWRRAETAGFQEKMLHPLERHLYQEFTAGIDGPNSL